jgi:oligo-1,6-glucosidase
VVALGDFTMLLPDDEQVYAFTRRLGDVELLVLGNFSGGTAVVDVPDADAWVAGELLLGNYPAESVPAAASLTLRPWEARVYRRMRR